MPQAYLKKEKKKMQEIKKYNNNNNKELFFLYCANTAKFPQLMINEEFW